MRSRSLAVAFLLCTGLLSSALLEAQDHPVLLSFDVASVRPAAPHISGEMIGGMTGGPGTNKSDRITGRLVTLEQLLRTAYGVRPFQISGPNWLSTERYDVVANIPPGTTKDQLNVMLQSLIAERFHLKLHHETKVFPSYELVVANGGPKLSTTGDVPSPAKTPTGAPVKTPLRKGMMMSGPVNGGVRLVAALTPMSTLVRALEIEVDRFPVEDKTGLTGEYNITLEYAPNNALQREIAMKQSGIASDADFTFPLLTTALQQQLGLKLVKGSGSFDVLVIDSVDKTPTDN